MQSCMSTTAAAESPLEFVPPWQGDGSHRIPFGVYTDAALHQREMERFFYRSHWCYVGLEAEIPRPGDFKRTAVGERSVILLRDNDGQVRVVENVCAHRGGSSAASVPATAANSSAPTTNGTTTCRAT